MTNPKAGMQLQLTRTTLKRQSKGSLKIRGEKRDDAIEAVLKPGLEGKELDKYLVQVVDNEPASTDLIKMLLEFGASVHYKNDLCMILAASKCDFPTLKLLAGFVAPEKSKDTFSNVLHRSFEKGTVWIMPTKEEMTLFLLEKGACGQAVDFACVRTIERYEEHPKLRDLLNLLLEHGADVNFNQGYVVTHACKLADESLIKTLLAKELSQTVRVNGLLSMIDSKASDDQLAGLIEILITAPANKKEHKLLHTPRSAGLLKKFLERRPSDLHSLQKLLDHGCPTVGSSINAKENQNLSVLYWAISEKQYNISIPCISAIIKAASTSGDINYCDSASGKTPLLVAIETGRYEVAAELVGQGAKFPSGSVDGKSFSFFAASRDSGLLQAIVAKGTDKDDGSLQEASRKFQVDSVKCLLKAGHDPNYPSPIHEERGALAELCSKAHISTANQEKGVATIKALIEGGADHKIRDRGKPLLILSLDHKESYLMTKALLTAITPYGIDEDFNICNIEGTIYSPTMYITKTKATSRDRDALLALLERHTASRFVYYSKTAVKHGSQPADAVGMPDDILAVERARRQRDAILQAEKDAVARAERERKAERDHQRALAEIQTLSLQTKVLVEEEHARTMARYRLGEAQGRARILRGETMYLPSSGGRSRAYSQPQIDWDVSEREREREREALAKGTAKQRLLQY